MNTKVLIIGQAPPNVSQKYPYDTTQLYDWLSEIGVSKERAQEIFEFDAVYDRFPGFDSNGGHLKPTKEQMDEYWERGLKNKARNSKTIILLGNVARDYFNLKNTPTDVKVYNLIHPSKRNISIYNKNKDSILSILREAIKE